MKTGGQHYIVGHCRLYVHWWQCTFRSVVTEYHTTLNKLLCVATRTSVSLGRAISITRWTVTHKTRVVNEKLMQICLQRVFTLCGVLSLSFEPLIWMPIYANLQPAVLYFAYVVHTYWCTMSMKQRMTNKDQANEQLFVCEHFTHVMFADDRCDVHVINGSNYYSTLGKC